MILWWLRAAPCRSVSSSWITSIRTALSIDDSEDSPLNQEVAQARQDYIPVHPRHARRRGDQRIRWIEPGIFGTVQKPVAVGMAPTRKLPAGFNHRCRDVKKHRPDLRPLVNLTIRSQERVYGDHASLLEGAGVVWSEELGSAGQGLSVVVPHGPSLRRHLAFEHVAIGLSCSGSPAAASPSETRDRVRSHSCDNVQSGAGHRERPTARAGG
jgi:hypothetical protein